MFFAKEKFINEMLKQKELVFNGRDCYIYSSVEGYWHKISEHIAQRVLRDKLSKEDSVGVSGGVIRQILDTLRQCPQLQWDLSNSRNDCINLVNGVYNIGRNNLTEHSPQYSFTYFVNFSYIPNSRWENAPTFTKYLSKTFDGEEIELLLEIFGYCVSSLTAARKMFLFIGKSASGKTKLLELLGRVVGEDFYTSLPIQHIAGRFNIIELKDARLNITQELPSKTVPSLDIIKSIVGGERVYGEHKGKMGESFTAKTRLIAAGNVMFGSGDGDTSDAFYDRLVFLMFKRGTEQKERDTSLGEKLWQERDVFFSQAVDRLWNLQCRNYQFTMPKSSLAFLENYRSGQNPITEFVVDRCVFGSEHRVHTSELYGSYGRYCRENCFDKVESRQQFLSHILSCEGTKKCKFRLNGSEPRHGIVGVRLKTGLEMEEDVRNEE